MGMAMAMVVIVMASSILMGCMIVNVDCKKVLKEQQKVIYVGGKVVCQDCNKADWEHDVKPIKGSNVSITCMDDKSKKLMYNGSDKTDDKGEFELIIVGNGKESMVNANLCTVKLVSSPTSDCYVPTDYGGGRLGVKLSNIRPSDVQGKTKYKVGTFSYTTPLCDETDY